MSGSSPVLREARKIFQRPLWHPNPCADKRCISPALPKCSSAESGRRVPGGAGGHEVSALPRWRRPERVPEPATIVSPSHPGQAEPAALRLASHAAAKYCSVELVLSLSLLFHALLHLSKSRVWLYSKLGLFSHYRQNLATQNFS